MAVRQGTAIVWGCSATDVSGFTAAAGDITVTGEDVTFASEETVVRNRLGQTSTLYYWDPRTEVSLTCYPSGDSASATATPLPGEKVTIVAGTDSDIAGDFTCQSCSKTRSNEGHVEFSITCVKYSEISPAQGETILN